MTDTITPRAMGTDRACHDAVAKVDGVRSESEGAEPNRRVVVLPNA